MSLFSHLSKAPVIEVFALSDRYHSDDYPTKVNLTVGAYRNEHGDPWVLPVVKKAEELILADTSLNKEYLPITGLSDFCQNALKVLLGEDSSLLKSKKCDGVQGVGGTGALFLCLKFLRDVMKYENVIVTKPTWPNHKGMSLSMGYNVIEIPYWDAVNKRVAFEEMIKGLENVPEKSVVILHACAHNPTGIDLSKDQWKEVARVIRENKIFSLIDIAYQGFASGDLEADAWAVRYFAESGFEFLVSQSFSKNFGLYNQRIGNAAIITKDPVATELVKDQMKIIVRKTWSNPPEHGARIVSTVLSNPSLLKEWKDCVKAMAERVIDMRQKLFKALQDLETPGDWQHIVKQIGMFSYTGLTKSQAEEIRSKFHIYMLSDGRINMCGLNDSNLDYLARAIHSVVTSTA